VRTGSLLFVSGQISLGTDGKLVAKGKLGDGVSIEDGQKGALAGPVADESFGAAQLRVVGIDGDQAEHVSAVGEQGIRRLIRHERANAAAELLFLVAFQTKRGNVTGL
jgi:hypothetical protein